MARYDIYDGIISSGITLSYDSMYISSGGTANNTIVNRGSMHIYSGGTANNTIVSRGYMYISSGGTANCTTLTGTYDSGAYMYISSGGTANCTTLTGTYNSGAYMYISSGGTANSTTVNFEGVMYISSGGTANSTTVNSGGYMDILSGGVANSTTVNSRGVMYIYSDGVANSTTVNSLGAMVIWSGGVANSTTVNYGVMYISSGGTANSTTVNSGGYMDILSGGVANSTTVNSGCRMYISSGGTATALTLYQGGVLGGFSFAEDKFFASINNGSAIISENVHIIDHDMHISSGGVANSTTVNYGVMYISSGGVANSTTVNYGVMYIYSGGVANSTTVSRGSMYISSGGTANSTTVNSYGSMYISSGGTANSTTVNDYGSMYISSGGTHRGTLQIANGAYVSAYEGSKIDFTVSERTTSAGYIINNLSLVKGTPIYTITVKKNQAEGTYKLAQGAKNFIGTLTITNSNGDTKSITVNGGEVDFKGQAYSLTQNNGNLLLNIVGEGDFIPPEAPKASANITKMTNQNVTVSATFASDSVKNEYRIGNGSWQLYSGAIEITSNGSVSFRSTDRADNVSDITTYSVNNIDKVAPNKPSVNANITAQTKQDVTVSAYFSNDSVKKQYSLDNKNWQSYPSNGVVMKLNGVVYFRGIDEAGNISQVASYNVTNILRGKAEIFSSGISVSRAEIITGAEIISGRNNSMCVNSAGTAINTTVKSGGCMFVYTSGTAESTTVTSGGTVSNNGVVSGLNASSGANVYGSGLWILTQDTRIASGVAGQIQDQQYTSTRIFSGFSNFAASSGFNWLVNEQIELKDTQITSGGILSFDSGASATKINNSGTLHIGYHVNVRSTINSGCINVNSGGILVLDENRYSGVENVNFGGSSWRTVNYGTQNIYSGGIAASAAILSKGVQNIYSGATAEKTMVSSGGLQNVSGGRADYTQLLPGGSQFVFRNGLAWSTFVDRGSQHISSGGLANYTSVSHGSQYISSGGVVSNTTLYGNLKQFSQTVHSHFNYTGDYIYWYNSGGSRCIVSSGWGENVVSTTTVYWFGYTASQSVSSGGNAKNTILSSGAIQTVYNGGSALDTDVKADAFQYVLSGGEIFRSTVSSGGILAVEYDGYGENINVLSGGAIGVHGVVRDLTIDKDAEFYFHMGEAVFQGYLDCFVTEKSVNALSEILAFSNDLDTLYLRMNFDNDYLGSYTLVESLPWDFDTEIVIGDFQGNYGTLTVDGEAIIRHGVSYQLKENYGSLILTVSGEYVEPDFNSDLDRNGLSDVILRHTKQGFTGAWLTTGDESIIKWGNLSDIKDDVRLLGTGKLYGSENDGQDIFFADGKSVGAWKVVEGKVTGYQYVMGVNATTNVLGLGDFNGDGAADILLRSTSGDLGYFGTDGTGWEYLKGLGWEWDIAAVGDLNGDGLDDTVLRHDAGFAGTFLTQADGTVKWANLDTLANDMTIVGTGDFNGDGVDDVLLQKADGWVGAWLVEDGSVDGFMGICKNTNAIEQIADFNGDGIDDLRIRTATGDIGVLYVNGADDTTWQYFQSVGSEWETKFSALA